MFIVKWVGISCLLVLIGVNPVTAIVGGFIIVLFDTLFEDQN